MLARRTAGSKVPREATCALWLAQFPAEEKQGRLEGPETMPSLRGTPRPNHLCTDTLHPASGGGPGSPLKQGSAGCDGHARQAESSRAHPALGASAAAPWPRPQPHRQKAGHTGCSVPSEGPGDQMLISTFMTMETKDSWCKTDQTLRVHAVSPQELQTLGVGPFLKKIWSLLL